MYESEREHCAEHDTWIDFLACGCYIRSLNSTDLNSKLSLGTADIRGSYFLSVIWIEHAISVFFTALRL